MNGLRLLLMFLWLAFGLTATAHASAMNPNDTACHMPATDMAHMPKDSKPHQDEHSAMPCCSQPMTAAVAEAVIALPLQLKPLRLAPPLALPLDGLTVPRDPHPPKAG